MLKLYIRLQNF